MRMMPTINTQTAEEIKEIPSDITIFAPEYPSPEEEIKLLQEEIVLLNKRIESLQKSLIESATKEKVVYVYCVHCRDEEQLPK